MKNYSRGNEDKGKINVSNENQDDILNSKKWLNANFSRKNLKHTLNI